MSDLASWALLIATTALALVLITVGLWLANRLGKWLIETRKN